MGRGGRSSRFRRSGAGSRAHYYASRRGAADDQGKRGSSLTLLLALPLATFTAVFLWDGPPPSFALGWGDPPPSQAELNALYNASEAELAQRRWPTTAAMLDGAQPDVPARKGEAGAGNFPLCEGAERVNCVVDGDTFWYRGDKIHLADVNTPETSDAGCPQEAALGARAARRLQDLLNQGAFSLGLTGDGRDTDRYGRKLRTVERNGASVGDTLVGEGLAERWKGRRSSWC